MLFPIIITIICISAIVILLFALTGKKNGSSTNNNKIKDRATIIKNANRRLAQDPHDPEGLVNIGDLYFKEQLWEKALPIYETLIDLVAAHPQLDQGQAALRYGVCALKLNRIPDAMKGLYLAKQLMPTSFEANFYLGQACFLNKEYEKAIPLFRQASVLNTESGEVQKYLGLSLVRNHNYRDSLQYLKHALDLEPENKELLFSMGEAMSEIGSNERALKIFMHLRPDPEFGSRAALYAGMIHASSNQIDKAIQDFEIGLKHTNINADQMNDLRYRLATCYIKNQELAKALRYLKEIQAITSGYKDVNALIGRYQELNQNKNLQIYLIANSSDFVALCRKIVMAFYKRSRVKILDIDMHSDYAEILTEVDTPKWEDTIVFRFYRSSGVIGELLIRDFHGKIRDAKAGRGVCLTAGTFSDEAVKFTEGRPIDLLDKQKLCKVLNIVDTNG